MDWDYKDSNALKSIAVSLAQNSSWTMTDQPMMLLYDGGEELYLQPIIGWQKIQDDDMELIVPLISVDEMGVERFESNILRIAPESVFIEACPDLVKKCKEYAVNGIRNIIAERNKK